VRVQVASVGDDIGVVLAGKVGCSFVGKVKQQMGQLSVLLYFRCGINKLPFVRHI
jgi:hypothetical protein